MSINSKVRAEPAGAAIDEPRKIEAIFASDQAALEEREVYRAPDGLYFEVAERLDDGGVITDAGIRLEAEYFAKAERFL